MECLTSTFVGANRDLRVYVVHFGNSSPSVIADHVYELARSGNGWNRRDLTAELRTPKAVAVAATSVGDAFDPRVYYVSSECHVHEFAWSGGAWHDRDLSAETRGPAAINGVAAMAFGANRDPRVYYATGHPDNHLHELAWAGGSWHDRDLTAEAQAPQVSSSWAAVGAGRNLEPHVFYRDYNNHVHELAQVAGGAWRDHDLSAEVGASAAAYALAAMAAGPNLDPRVYYSTTGSQIVEFAWSGGRWQEYCLPVEYSAPVGYGALAAIGYGAGLDPHVYYSTPDCHVHECAWTGNRWHDRDLTADLNAPVGTGALTATLGANNFDPHAFYVADNLLVHEFAHDGMWNLRNLMPADQTTLNVPLCGQKTNMWCWAASGEMVMTYLRHPVTQCAQANWRFERNDCCNQPVPGGCVQGGWPQFDHWGFSCRAEWRCLSFDELRLEIDSYRPVLYSWGWYGGGGHAMVARGYNAGRGLVYINDPWPPNVGRISWITYAAYNDEGHYHWQDFFKIRYTGPGGPGGAEHAPGDGEQEETMTQGSVPPAGKGFGDAEAAAQDALQLFAELVTPETAQEMGFDTAPVDPAALSLSEPLHVYTIPLESVQDYQAGADISGLLTDTGQLCYPVMMDGKIVSSVTVGNQGGQWTLVSLGDADLTRDLVDARAASAQRTGKALTEYFIVSIPALYAMFVAHRDDDGNVQFTHVHEEGARQRGVARHTTEAADDVLAALRAQAPPRKRGAEGPRVVPF